MDLYLSRRRTVIPFNLSLGAIREDGYGGASRVYADARSDAQRFLRLDPALEASAGARLAAIGMSNSELNASATVDTTLGILKEMDRPRAFYVRLLNRAHDKFEPVERFFRSVVDPVVEDAGYRRIEVGTDKAEEGFMNVEIFKSLHDASLVIVDVTGSRPNCFMELGYALGRGTRVLVSTEDGTDLPFDQAAIPTLMWNPNREPTELIEEFKKYWTRVIDRRVIAT